MNAAAATISDPQAARVALVLDALARDADLSTAEIALLDEVARVPEVQAAVVQREHRQHWERVRIAREQEAEREAARVARVEPRRASWRTDDPDIRELHVLAEKFGAKSELGRFALAWANLKADPKSTLLTRGGVDQFGDRRQRVERAPPATYQPSGYPADDPVNEETT